MYSNNSEKLDHINFGLFYLGKENVVNSFKINLINLWNIMFQTFCSVANVCCGYDLCYYINGCLMLLACDEGEKL